jgi:hypothetical protein
MHGHVLRAPGEDGVLLGMASGLAEVFMQQSSRYTRRPQGVRPQEKYCEGRLPQAGALSAT